MSWKITPSFYGYITDADAKDYLARVHAAEGQTLEPAVALAVEAFVVGCKNDGIWPAIKASCILAGARTLSGALVPLVGAAPTNFNFVSGDYNRKTGLVGNGSTKYLDGNRNNNADPQNSNHNTVWVSDPGSGGTQTLMGANGSSGAETGTNGIIFFSGNLFTRNRCSTGSASSAEGVGLSGMARNTSSEYLTRSSNTTSTISVSSQPPFSSNLLVFRRPGNFPNYATARLAFYSIGESLDLALLDGRVTTLINAFDAAI